MHQAKEAFASSISLLAAITAWQEQVEFWLRITATLVAITAGLVTITMALRKKGPPPA